MSDALKIFRGSFIITFIGLILGLMIGGPLGIFVCTMLAIVEVSLSFDNAVLNAKVLENMDAVWRQRFLTWGMVIAVFGMRIVFPVMIVSFSTGLSMFGALDIALNNPVKYEEVITASHLSIAGFGGSFLMLVFLKFFIDEEKETHWIGPIEHVLAKIGSVDMAEVFITLSAVLIVQSALPSTESMQFLVAGIAGICTFIIVDILGQLVELAKSAATTMGKGLISAGFANFLYLEVVDASFSFDGVIGAFAITKNFLLIAIGLGIGAMFVRSMTIYLVEKKTLQAFKYLEHGAFWSIGMLAAIMFASTITHIPELATGLLTLATIGAAVWHSIKTSKQGELA